MILFVIQFVYFIPISNNCSSFQTTQLISRVIAAAPRCMLSCLAALFLGSIWIKSVVSHQRLQQRVNLHENHMFFVLNTLRNLPASSQLQSALIFWRHTPPFVLGLNRVFFHMQKNADTRMCVHAVNCSSEWEHTCLRCLPMKGQNLRLNCKRNFHWPAVVLSIFLEAWCFKINLKSL